MEKQVRKSIIIWSRWRADNLSIGKYSPFILYLQDDITKKLRALPCCDIVGRMKRGEHMI